MITLRRALALTEWDGVTVLQTGPETGTGSRSGAIAGVEVLADPRAPIPERQDALVVLISDPGRGTWLLDVLIRRVAASRAVALMIGGTAPLGRASDTIAARLQIPVLGAPDPLAAAVALQVHLTLPELAAARWVGSACTALRTAQPGVGSLVAAAGQAFERDIWLLDSAGHLVAGSTAHGPDWNTATEEVHHVNIARRLQAPVGPDSRFVHLVVATDHPRGAYLLIRRLDTDDLRSVLDGLAVLAEAMAGRLAVQRLSAERDARQRMSLMAELLQSGGQLSPEAPRRMLDHGWTVDGWHIGVRLDVPATLDPVALRLDVLQAFSEAGLDAHVVENGMGWAAWTTFADNPTQRQVQAYASAVRRVQWRLRTHLPTVMGVGSLQRGPEGLVRTLGEATDAAKIATTRAAGGHLVYVDRLGLSQLLLAWTRTDTFSPAASSMLTPLASKPELLQTLAAFLDAESSIAETAAVLGIHRNTVSARIARSVELLGVDLNDPDERLAIQLACRSVLSSR